MTPIGATLTAANTELVTNIVKVSENGFIRHITVITNDTTTDAVCNFIVKDGDGSIIYTSANITTDAAAKLTNLSSLSIPIDYGWTVYMTTADPGASGLEATVRMYIESV